MKGGERVTPPLQKYGVINMVKQLASGIDTLTLSLDIIWRNDQFFNALQSAKDNAIEFGKEVPITIDYSRNKSWLFSVMPYGRRGYSWVVESRWIKLSIGNWIEPQSMPSMKVEFSSEALWTMGAYELFETLKDIIESNGGYVTQAKVSRIDLCMDILIDDTVWEYNYLTDHLVTRATKRNIHFDSKILETYAIGSKDADLQARLYDKVREITNKSKKYWMFDIWNLDHNDIKNNQHVIRVEFEIKREVIKQLCHGRINDVLEKINYIWLYCTSSWLKFMDQPERHYRYRKVLEFWKTVQSNFMGIEERNIAIREKLFRPKREDLIKQVKGIFTSIVTMDLRKEKIDIYDYGEVEPHFISLFDELTPKDDYEVAKIVESVLVKMPKYYTGC